MKRRTPDAPPADPTPIAFSYVRFSHPDQAKGDSVRRQDDAAADWCRRNGVRLDTTLTFRDLGRSAYLGDHRKNPDRHDLARFLRLVQDGRVPRGAYFVIENLDRLSREHIRPALTLLLNLIDAGVRVVQLKPVEQVFDEDVEPMALMMAIMELSRGHNESAMKSERVGGAWAEKKRRAAEELVTRRLPAWLEERGGKAVLVPKKAAAVRRIFHLARDGYGIGAIAKRLNAEKVPPITSGKACGKFWGQSYVAKILGNRAAVGEYQPHTRRGGKRRPEGDPVAGYYPAAVTEGEWNAAHAAMASRKLKGGRPSPRVNLFTGLLRSAADGSTMEVANKGKKGGGPVVVSRHAVNGVAGGAAASFPLDTLERAVLSLLKEIDPREVLGRDEGTNEASDLADELGAVEAELAKLGDALNRNGHSETLEKAVRFNEDRKRELVPLLRAALQRAASPLSEAWGECRGLIDALDAAPDPADARVRLRGALRRIAESMWILVVPQRSRRLAAVQIWFAGGACRSYLILHTPAFASAAARRPASWEARSLAAEAGGAEIDLRDREQAERLARELASVEFNS